MSKSAWGSVQDNGVIVSSHGREVWDRDYAVVVIVSAVVVNLVGVCINDRCLLHSCYVKRQNPRVEGGSILWPAMGFEFVFDCCCPHVPLELHSGELGSDRGVRDKLLLDESLF